MPAKGGHGLDLYRMGGEPFGREVIYSSAPRGLDRSVHVRGRAPGGERGDRAHRHRRRGEGIRWRVMMTRNILRLSATMLRPSRRCCTATITRASATRTRVRYLDGMLGKGVLFMQDPAKNKVNNLLFHLKRLVTEELEKGGLAGADLEEKLKAFEPHEAQWHISMRKMIEFNDKVQDLRALLESTVDEENRNMSCWFDTLVAERVEPSIKWRG